MGEAWIVRKQPPCLVKPRFHGARASADRRRDLLLTQSGVVTKHEWRSEPSGKRQDRLAHEGGTVALVNELVRCGIARDDRVERVLRGPPAGVSGLGSCRGIAGVHDDPVDPWPQSVSFWEGVSESPEAQERLLNGIVDFRGVTEEESGCAVRGRVPLMQEFLELARIGVGNHVCKTLRHRRRFDFPPEQARHRSTAWTPDAGAATSARVPRGLSGRLPEYSAGVPGALRRSTSPRQGESSSTSAGPGCSSACVSWVARRKVA